MLNYALEHRKAVDAITQDREWGLRPCELDNDEWEMLDELRDVLKVRAQSRVVWLCVLTSHRNGTPFNTGTPDSQRCDRVFLKGDT